MFDKLSIRDLTFNGKKVLMRVDFNVPLDKEGKITDDSRIQASLPSIRHVLDHGGAVILMSHFGRPKGKASPEFSLSPCATRLSELLNKRVTMAPDSTGDKVASLTKDLQPGDVVLLENLRFNPGEEKPEEYPEFAKELASLADLYVDDAFGSAHRAHASVTAVPKLFPNKAAAGFLLEKELEYLGRTLAHPKRPFYAVLGGAKLGTKIGVIKALLKKVDGLFLGGGMAPTFLKAKGLSIGNSLFDPDFLKEAEQILKDCESQKFPLWLPQDVVAVKKVEAGAESRVVDLTAEGIPDGWEGVDIGPKTISTYTRQLQNARTIFWNGPLGVFEIPEFAKGTYAIADAISKIEGVKIVGGGESIAAVNARGLADKMSHISTGGGASLEFIEFGTLPGIEALSDKTG